MLTLIGLILGLILFGMFIGFIGNVIAGFFGLIFMFVRFPISMSIIAFVVWLWWSGNLTLPT